jgi:hypothetical protein
LQVGTDGNPNRYDGSICWYVRFAILGGETEQRLLSLWGRGFFIFKGMILWKTAGGAVIE